MAGIKFNYKPTDYGSDYTDIYTTGGGGGGGGGKGGGKGGGGKGGDGRGQGRGNFNTGGGDDNLRWKKDGKGPNRFQGDYDNRGGGGRQQTADMAEEIMRALAGGGNVGRLPKPASGSMMAGGGRMPNQRAPNAIMDALGGGGRDEWGMPRGGPAPQVRNQMDPVPNPANGRTPAPTPAPGPQPYDAKAYQKANPGLSPDILARAQAARNMQAGGMQAFKDQIWGQNTQDKMARGMDVVNNRVGAGYRGDARGPILSVDEYGSQDGFMGPNDLDAQAIIDKMQAGEIPWPTGYTPPPPPPGPRRR